MTRSAVPTVTPLKFTHTSYQSEVFVYPNEVFAITFMPTFKSVALISRGGAAVPVVGSLEEITKQVTAAKEELRKTTRRSK